MPEPGLPLRRLGVLTIGSFDPADPASGHESTLRVIERAEELGLDSVWLRQRHLQYGISSPATVIAAASQRTSRIHLGTAVIPLGLENPLRLAEDLATADVLSGGRVNPGFSTGTPLRFEEIREALYPGTWKDEDFGYDRLLRLRAFVRGDAVGTGLDEGFEQFSTRVEPHAPGLVDRLWYGAGSDRSARWAGTHGFHLLLSSVVTASDGGGADFATIQRAQIDAYREERARAGYAPGRVSQGLVVIPTDSATPAQVEKYRAYVARRDVRVGVPQGPTGMLFAADLVGPAAEIAERLAADAAYRAVDEVAFALPFGLDEDDYTQLIGDIAGALGPALGWRPAA